MHLGAERYVVGSQGPETDDEETRERRETRVLEIEKHNKKQRRVKAKAHAQGAAKAQGQARAEAKGEAQGAAEAKGEAEGAAQAHAQVKFGYSDEDNPDQASSSSNSEQDSLHQHEPRLAGAIGMRARGTFQLGIRAQCRRPPSPTRARRASFGSQPDRYSDTTARVSQGVDGSASVGKSVRSKVFNHARKVYKEKMGTTEVPSTLHRPSTLYPDPLP
eukprot:COSAG05_NODE_161_length_15568_cov_97.196328_6_plen_218_part_00